jgi:CO/xanthine dehydrogenase Mo-binding subunit
VDELASRLGIDPITFCATNIIGPGEPMIAWGDPSDDEEHDDLRIASYGLDQCLDVVRDAAHTDGPAAPDGWLVGHGTAIAMIATGPPGGHIADARLTLTEDGRYDIAVGTAEFGNGTTTVHAQIAAGTLGTTADRVTVRQSDTDLVRHDTSTFASTGVVVAARPYSVPHKRYARTCSRSPRNTPAPGRNCAT